MNNLNYYSKYLKYKNKYYNLKKNLSGGDNFEVDDKVTLKLLGAKYNGQCGTISTLSRFGSGETKYRVVLDNGTPLDVMKLNLKKNCNSTPADIPAPAVDVPTPADIPAPGVDVPTPGDIPVPTPADIPVPAVVDVPAPAASTTSDILMKTAYDYIMMEDVKIGDFLRDSDEPTNFVYSIDGGNNYYAYSLDSLIAQNRFTVRRGGEESVVVNFFNECKSNNGDYMNIIEDSKFIKLPDGSIVKLPAWYPSTDQVTVNHAEILQKTSRVFHLRKFKIIPGLSSLQVRFGEGIVSADHCNYRAPVDTYELVEIPLDGTLESDSRDVSLKRMLESSSDEDTSDEDTSDDELGEKMHSDDEPEMLEPERKIAVVEDSRGIRIGSNGERVKPPAIRYTGEEVPALFDADMFKIEGKYLNNDKSWNYMYEVKFYFDGKLVHEVICKADSQFTGSRKDVRFDKFKNSFIAAAIEFYKPVGENFGIQIMEVRY